MTVLLHLHPPLSRCLSTTVPSVNRSIRDIFDQPKKFTAVSRKRWPKHRTWPLYGKLAPLWGKTLAHHNRAGDTAVMHEIVGIMKDINKLPSLLDVGQFSRHEKLLDVVKYETVFSPYREMLLLDAHEKLSGLASKRGHANFAEMQFKLSPTRAFDSPDEAKDFLTSSFEYLRPIFGDIYHEVKTKKQAMPGHIKYHNEVHKECIAFFKWLEQPKCFHREHLDICDDSLSRGDLIIALRKLCEISFGITFEVEPLKRGEKKFITKDANGPVIKLRVRDTDQAEDLGFIWCIINKGNDAAADASQIFCSVDEGLPTARLRVPVGENELINLEDVSALVHEFGHCLHFLLYQSSSRKPGMVSNTYSFDLIEIPSIVMEMFCLHPQFLHLVANPNRSTKPLSPPYSLFDVMNRFSPLGMTSSQIHMDLFALEFFSHPGPLTSTMDVADNVALYSIFDQHPTTVLHHHDLRYTRYLAQHYAYTFAQAVANLVFFELFDADTFNPDAGRKWKEFLRRDWNQDGFYESLSSLVGRPVTKKDLPVALTNPIVYHHRHYSRIKPVRRYTETAGC